MVPPVVMDKYTIVNYNALMRLPLSLGLVMAIAMTILGECILIVLSLIVTVVTVLTLAVMAAVVVALAVETLVVEILVVEKVVNLTGQLMVVQTVILHGMSMEFHVLS